MNSIYIIHIAAVNVIYNELSHELCFSDGSDSKDGVI